MAVRERAGRGTWPGVRRVMRMSVEQPLWRALTGYRVLTMLYAVAALRHRLRRVRASLGRRRLLCVLAVWTLATLPRVANAASCTKRFLAADLTVALAGILLTPLADTHARIQSGGPTLPSIWTAGSVLAFAIKGGWRWAAFASTLVAVANLVERGDPGPRHRPQRDAGLGRLHRHRLRRRGRPRLRAHPRPRPGDRGRDPRTGAARPGHPRQRPPGAGDGAAARHRARRRGRRNWAGWPASRRSRCAPSSPAASSRRHARLARTRPREPVAARPWTTGRPDDAGGRRCDLRTLLAPYAGSPSHLLRARRPRAARRGPPRRSWPPRSAPPWTTYGSTPGEDARAWILVEDEPDAVS